MMGDDHAKRDEASRVQRPALQDGQASEIRRLHDLLTDRLRHRAWPHVQHARESLAALPQRGQRRRVYPM